MSKETIHVSIIKEARYKENYTEKEWHSLCELSGADPELTTRIYINAIFEFNGKCKN